MNQLYRFKPDIKTVITLKRKLGKPFKMGLTTGFTYTLRNGLTCRVSDQANLDIQALHLDAGQPFQVTKRTIEGNEFAWDIERVPGSPPNNRPAERVNTTQPETVPTGEGFDEYFSDTTPAIFKTEHGRDVLMHLIGAIEIAAAAEKYAKNQLGRALHFSTNDIRAIAISCSIQQSHEQVEFNRNENAREPMVSRVLLTTSADRCRVSGSPAR